MTQNVPRMFYNFQELFRTGNVLQFVSRSSGRTLQIVTSPTGALVVDGAGMEGPQVGNGKSAVIGYCYFVQPFTVLYDLYTAHV